VTIIGPLTSGGLFIRPASSSGQGVPFPVRAARVRAFGPPGQVAVTSLPAPRSLRAYLRDEAKKLKNGGNAHGHNPSNHESTSPKHL
jgi:hypothetical protein